MRNTAKKPASSLWEVTAWPVVQAVTGLASVQVGPLPDSEGYRLLKALQKDSVWPQRSGVLYQGVYMPRAEYIALLTRLLLSDYEQALAELSKQLQELDALKDELMLPALSTELIDEFWQVFSRIQDVLHFASSVFWYGVGTGYENGLINPTEYIARCQGCIESGEIRRIEAAIVAMQRTLDPWKAVHGDRH
ncbi:MAG: hypothetical protein AUF65_01630 [Chloroflexi bacterium 13_1_20CM_50_12]|nr:MAG: hypothetical protein AUF65_01630 [Chloroflexi bacterium 13_1_20CM_50_12]